MDTIPPDHDDYQVIGNCRRYIARCLPISERAYQISYQDVMLAFDDAEQNGTSLLSVTNHDFRDMKVDIEKVMKLVYRCATEKKISHLNTQLP